MQRFWYFAAEKVYTNKESAVLSANRKYAIACNDTKRFWEFANKLN